MVFNNLKFHNRKNMDTSVEFSFAGIGLMGCRVVNTISQLEKDGKQLYPTLGININKEDLDQPFLKTKLLLESPFKAAGRDPVKGYQAIAANEERVKKALLDLARDSNFLWLVAGLGGGTGTGGILQLIEWASEIKTHLEIPFGIIVSLPREKDGTIENKNALIVLQQLNELAAAGCVPIIIVDNEVLYNRYLERTKTEKINREWTEDSNIEIAGLLHQLNIITTQVPFGNKHFDGQEFLNVLTTGGCIQFSKTVLDIKDFNFESTVKQNLKETMENGIACSGFNISSAETIGISLFAPNKPIASMFFHDISNFEVMENAILDIAPNAEIFWGTYVDPVNSASKNIEIYSIISGLGLPMRVEKITKLAVKQKSSSESKKLKLDVHSLPQEEPLGKPIITNPFASQKAPVVVNTLVFESNSESKAFLQEVPEWLKK